MDSRRRGNRLLLGALALALIAAPPELAAGQQPDPAPAPEMPRPDAAPGAGAPVVPTTATPPAPSSPVTNTPSPTSVTPPSVAPEDTRSTGAAREPSTTPAPAPTPQVASPRDATPRRTAARRARAAARRAGADQARVRAEAALAIRQARAEAVADRRADLRGDEPRGAIAAPPPAPVQTVAAQEPNPGLLGATLAVCALALAGIGVVARVCREWEPA